MNESIQSIALLLPRNRDTMKKILYCAVLLDQRLITTHAVLKQTSPSSQRIREARIDSSHLLLDRGPEIDRLCWVSSRHHRRLACSIRDEELAQLTATCNVVVGFGLLGGAGELVEALQHAVRALDEVVREEERFGGVGWGPFGVLLDGAVGC